MLNVVICNTKLKNTCFCMFVSFLHRLIRYCKSVSKLLQGNVSCIFDMRNVKNLKVEQTCRKIIIVHIVRSEFFVILMQH